MFCVPSALRAACAGVALLAISSCSTGDVMRPVAVVGNAPVDMIRTAAYLPSVVNPLSTFSGSGSMPADEAACRRDLQTMGVRFEDLPPISEQGMCGIAHPVRVSALAGNIAIEPAATLNCDMARSFARWVRNDLAPQSRLRYFSGISKIHVPSAYSCRWIKGRVGGTLSEHGKGNAIDIGGLTLENGRYIDVRKPGFFAFRERGLLNNVRGEACDYFSTVLGPGYDADHKDHFHFDLKDRKNGYIACK